MRGPYPIASDPASTVFPLYFAHTKHTKDCRLAARTIYASIVPPLNKFIGCDRGFKSEVSGLRTVAGARMSFSAAGGVEQSPHLSRTAAETAFLSASWEPRGGTGQVHNGQTE